MPGQAQGAAVAEKNRVPRVPGVTKLVRKPVSGTHVGVISNGSNLTRAQRATLKRTFIQIAFNNPGRVILHHGCGRGADEFAHRFARERGNWRIRGHPRKADHHQSHSQTILTCELDEIAGGKPRRERDADIVDASDIVVVVLPYAQPSPGNCSRQQRVPGAKSSTCPTRNPSRARKPGRRPPNSSTPPRTRQLQLRRSGGPSSKAGQTVQRVNVPRLQGLLRQVRHTWIQACTADVVRVHPAHANGESAYSWSAPPLRTSGSPAAAPQRRCWVGNIARNDGETNQTVHCREHRQDH
jgi:hypothetical protein